MNTVTPGPLYEISMRGFVRHFEAPVIREVHGLALSTGRYLIRSDFSSSVCRDMSVWHEIASAPRCQYRMTLAEAKECARQMVKDVASEALAQVDIVLARLDA
jgi:hypothetical protein